MSDSARSFTRKTVKGLARDLRSDVGISSPFDPDKTPTPPTIRPYTAIWDTGATGTVISSRVVAECGLRPIAVTKVHGVHGEQMTNVHLVNVFLPNRVQFPGLRVTEGTLGNFDVLVGMDIITQGDFAVTHNGGNTQFSFRIPSLANIDFTQDHPEPAPAPMPGVGRNDPCPCGSGKKFKKCHGP